MGCASAWVCSPTCDLCPSLSLHWTLWQSEWATDLILENGANLTATMDAILRHAWITGNSARVLRYMDRPLTKTGRPFPNCPHEVMSRALEFHDGLRIRHWVEEEVEGRKSKVKGTDTHRRAAEHVSSLPPVTCDL